MTKLFIIILSSFFLSNIAWAHVTTPATNNNSLALSANKIHASNNHSQTNIGSRTPYTHKSEQSNSLARAVLAIQGVKVSLRFNSTSSVDYSRYTPMDATEQRNSLSHRVFAR